VTLLTDALGVLACALALCPVAFALLHDPDDVDPEE